MADNVKVIVFGVGQGLCTLIEVYEQDTGSLEYLALADCGSTSAVKAGRTGYVKNVEDMFRYIVKKAQERYRKTGVYYFDAVFLSHQDSDHWNLMMEVFSRILGIAKGESISVQDDKGICTQYLVGDGADNETIVCSYRKENVCEVWNISRQMEKFDEEYVSSAYGRTWNCYDATSINPSECIEVSYISDGVWGTLKAVHIVGNEKITIEYMAEDDNDNKEEASFLCDQLNHYIIYEKDKTEYDPGPMDFIDAIKELLSAIPWNPFVGEMYSILENNEHLDLECVKSNIRKGIVVQKIIRKVYFGGSEYGPRANAFKSKLSNMAAEATIDIIDEIKICGGRITLRMVEPFSLHAIHDLDLHKEKEAVGIRRNRSSLFIMLYYPEGMAILPGDATVHTMKSFCYLQNKGDIRMSGSTKVLVAPHHGSETTSRDKPSDYTTLKRFLRTVKPERILVSIGIDNRHHHPGESFIEAACTAVTKVTEEHDIYVYICEDGYGYATAEDCVYTTVMDDKYENLTYNSEAGTSKSNSGQKTRKEAHRELPDKNLFV